MLFRCGLRTGTNKPTARPDISERAFYLTVPSPAHVKSQFVFCPCSLAPSAEKEGCTVTVFIRLMQPPNDLIPSLRELLKYMLDKRHHQNRPQNQTHPETPPK